MSRWRCRSRVPERVRRSCRRAARPRSGSPDWRTSARARAASARDTSGRGRAPPPTPSAPTRSRCRPCPRLMPLLRPPRAAYPTAMSFSSALRFSTLQLRGLDRDSRRVVDSTRRSMHNAPIGWWVLQWGAGAGRAGAASAGEGVDAGYDYAGVGHGPVPAGAQRHRARRSPTGSRSAAIPRGRRSSRRTTRGAPSTSSWRAGSAWCATPRRPPSRWPSSARASSSARWRCSRTPRAPPMLSL